MTAPAGTPTICPFEPVTENAWPQLAAPGAEIVLRGEQDLRNARLWLRRLLIFDRDHSCWVLLEPDQSHGLLLVADMNTQLRTPGHVTEAQCWAEQMLHYDDLARRQHHPDSSDVALAVTEWRQVRYGALHGYAPLTNLTPRCQLPLDDLDPATGRCCSLCSTRPPAHH